MKINIIVQALLLSAFQLESIVAQRQKSKQSKQFFFFYKQSVCISVYSVF